MSSRNKYAPDISFKDLSTFVREHKRSSGAEAVVVLHFGTGPGGADWAEVRLQTEPTSTLQGFTPMARGPVPTQQFSRIVSTLLHLMALAYRDLEANPWLWPPDKRKDARGEGSRPQ